MENVEQISKIAMMHQHVDETKAIMQTNIENILERGERIEELQEVANSLNKAAKVFKKKAKKVRRFKMMQDAKHGVVVGTAIAGVVGVVVIPPLIALL
jgi:vesicle-associated membrane protein 4